jgi:hypothetical protein
MDALLAAASAEAADLAVILQTLHGRLERLQFQIDECTENNLWSRSWQYPIPDHLAWGQPTTFTCFWVEYRDAFPRMPERPCIYHTGDRTCRAFKYRPSGVIWELPQDWNWLARRNHIWKACDECLERVSPPSKPDVHQGGSTSQPSQGPSASLAS